MIRFRSPVFIDGDPAQGKSLYLFVNQGEGGGTDISSLVTSDSEYLAIAVPNPDAVIAPAVIRASFCFLLGKFHRDYGVGPRRGVLKQSGLDLHALDVSGGATAPSVGVKPLDAAVLRVPAAGNRTFKEILFEDGGDAVAKANKAAAAMLSLSAVQASGGSRGTAWRAPP